MKIGTLGSFESLARTAPTMTTNATRHPRAAQLMTLCLLLIHGSVVTAQVINDPFEEAGDESYAPGGFGSFNWVTATDFGFSDHAGAEGFLSAYSGTPIANIGMVKPLGGSMAATTYRVSFHVSKYFASGIPFSEFSELYIGSATGTSVWDTVPTPGIDGVWEKWSGTFTPDAADIGQPFAFGFTLTLFSGRSIAIDGPVIVKDLATGLPEQQGANADLQVLFAPGQPYVDLHCEVPIVEMVVHDAQGRCVSSDRGAAGNDRRVDAALLPPGPYSVRCLCADGSWRVGRFLVL